MAAIEKRDLISIEDLSDQEIEEIFAIADEMLALDRRGPDAQALAGTIMATLFYEPSTRTRLSFESSMQRLGGSVISCPDMRSSSTAKGETLADTARVVSSYADVLVVRHYWDGAIQAMAEYAGVPVINAGDGGHEHPTQTLCDLYTLKKEKGDLKGLTVVICGDLKHGRTIHSLVYALARFGVNVVTLAAGGMELPQYVVERLESRYHYNLASVTSKDLQAVVTETDAIYLTPNQPHQLALFTQVDPKIQNRIRSIASGLKFDAFYMTRKQKERMKENGGPSAEYPSLDERFLKERRFKDTVVMHPLPRVDELSPAIDKDHRGIYFKQAANGVPIRMALLKFLLTRPAAAEGRKLRRGTALYESPEALGPECANTNCVTRVESLSARPRFEIVFTGPGGSLILRCFYCDHQLKVQHVGHSISKRYCPYDIALADTVTEWFQRRELAIFDSIKQAEELGYEPYKGGPQRSIMGEEEIRSAIHQMAEQILKESENLDRLLLLGVKTKGLILARRIAEEIERQSRRRIEVGEIEIFGSGEGIRRATAATDETTEPLALKDRPIVLVDDVIYTGRTVKSALSIIFKAGRPKSVRLAVLVDRGHREVPLKPNYVGKHIPTSEKERVRVKLREVEQDEKDKVVVYSIVTPGSAIEQEATG